MQRIVVAVFIGLLLMGCAKGDKGDAGPKGDKGDMGVGTKLFTGYIPYTGTTSDTQTYGAVSIGTGSLASSSAVIAYVDYGKTVWYECGSDANPPNPYSLVDYNSSTVVFYNCPTTWKYKIIVISPSAAPARYIDTLIYGG